ncbi:hypothetical protein Lal_00019441 [Lupinus albus]|nr:hypothetical protein Lal_00019441 [Lupinus albus]
MPSPPPIEIEITSTPSLTAASKAARISESKQPEFFQHTLSNSLCDSRSITRHACFKGIATSSGGCCVGPMAIGVTRGSEFNAARNGAEIRIGEATSLRPDAGVKNSDDDVRTVVRFGPETSLVTKAEKLRRASGVQVAATVLKDCEYRRMVAYRSKLLFCEVCREAMENGVV